jgi:hypothetical protein
VDQPLIGELVHEPVRRTTAFQARLDDQLTNRLGLSAIEQRENPSASIPIAPTASSKVIRGLEAFFAALTTTW